MAELSFQQVLDADDIITELVDVPEWGKDAQVRVRTLGADGLAAYEKSMLKIKGASQEPDIANHYSKLCVWGMCDPKGKLLFNASQIEALGRKSIKALRRVHDAIVRLNDLDKTVEQLAKNSNSIPASDSASDSPTT